MVSWQARGKGLRRSTKEHGNETLNQFDFTFPQVPSALGCCSDVHIMGTDHYVYGFTGIYVCIVGSGHYADLALQAHSS